MYLFLSSRFENYKILRRLFLLVIVLPIYSQLDRLLSLELEYLDVLNLPKRFLKCVWLKQNLLLHFELIILNLNPRFYLRQRSFRSKNPLPRLQNKYGRINQLLVSFRLKLISENKVPFSLLPLYLPAPRCFLVPNFYKSPLYIKISPTSFSFRSLPLKRYNDLLW